VNDGARRPRNAASQPALQDGDLLAAVDLGSNSFHMVVARYVLGQLRVVDRLREMVRLAEGLDGRGGLSPQVQQRALDCLARFGQRIHDIPPQRVRALATNTVRALARPQAFLVPAESALGHAIEVVSGREEARLVYHGVAHAQPPKPGQRRLVMDIGGGSTECIIGSGFDPIERESLQVGCVASTLRFFGDGKLSRRRWKEALVEVGAEFQQFARTYRNVGWDEALGSSGTLKQIGEICQATKLTKGSITAAAIPELRERLLRAGRIEGIDLPGLSDERRPIIAGGLLVAEAAFSALGLSRMAVSKAALREGALYDMLGRGGADDPREASVAALMQRYGIDDAQAARVEATALMLFDRVAADWKLDGDARRMLAWAARLHELGLAIAHSQYQLHGAYVLQNSDIAGFSQQEQQVLAALVRSHRRKVPNKAFDAIPDRLLADTRRIAALLRLAVLLHRSHEAAELPELRAAAKRDQLSLTLPARWLEQRPLLRADLDGEPADMAGLGIALDIRVD
jgi:exopolyphosphatase/guanosine-5'-triphosphate,3'-diphosphate pyrophosphatase